MQRNDRTRLCALVVASFLAGGAAQRMASAQVQDLYVVNNATDSVTQSDGATGALIATFGSAGVGGRPYGLTCAPNGNLLVTREEFDEVVEFDNATGALVGVFASAALNNPTGLAVGPNDNLLWRIALVATSLSSTEQRARSCGPLHRASRVRRSA